MATGPNRPRANLPFVDPSRNLSVAGLHTLSEMWRVIAAGYVIVPCTITGTNILTLTPILNAIGGQTLANYMTFAGVPPNGSTGAVTAIIGTLPAIKVYKSNGAAQAGNTDIVAATTMLFVYNSALDTGAGGLVLK